MDDRVRAAVHRVATRSRERLATYMIAQVEDHIGQQVKLLQARESMLLEMLDDAAIDNASDAELLEKITLIERIIMSNSRRLVDIAGPHVVDIGTLESVILGEPDLGDGAGNRQAGRERQARLNDLLTRLTTASRVGRRP